MAMIVNAIIETHLRPINKRQMSLVFVDVNVVIIKANNAKLFNSHVFICSSSPSSCTQSTQSSTIISGARWCGTVLVHNGGAPNLLEERNDGYAFVWPDIFTPGCDWLILSYLEQLWRDNRKNYFHTWSSEHFICVCKLEIKLYVNETKQQKKSDAKFIKIWHHLHHSVTVLYATMDHTSLVINKYEYGKGED